MANGSKCLQKKGALSLEPHTSAQWAEGGTPGERGGKGWPFCSDLVSVVQNKFEDCFFIINMC